MDVVVLLYVDLVDLILIVTTFFDVGTAYVSYKIATLTKYTPTAWYLVTIAFLLKIGRDGLFAVEDLLTPGPRLGLADSAYLLTIAVLFFISIFLLKRTFIELMKPQEQASA